jgi:transcriptional regulator NrdR family protein
MKCPHCNKSEIRRLPKDYYFTRSKVKITHICDTCGRGWGEDEKGNWHSFFATDIEVYSPDGKKLLSVEY